MDIPYSYQSSIGIQRQLNGTTAITADYVETRLKNTEIQRNVNLTYNPATGVNYPFTDVSRRAFPDWGLVNVVRFSKDGYQYDRGLQTAVTNLVIPVFDPTTGITHGIEDIVERPTEGASDRRAVTAVRAGRREGGAAERCHHGSANAMAVSIH